MLLCSVRKALPEHIKPLWHVGQIVSSYLLPKTLDYAAGNGWLNLMNRYETLPCTQRAMSLATYNEDFDTMCWLIDHKQLMIEDGAIDSTLSLAAKRNHVELVTRLYPSAHACDVGFALEQAADYKAWDVVKLLYNKCHPMFAGPALCDAAKDGQYEIVELLQTVCESYYLNSAILKAAKYGQIEIVSLLLDKCQPSFIGSVIVVAVQHKHYEIVKLLCDQRPTLSVALVTNNSGTYSAVEILRLQNGPERVTEALKKAIENDFTTVIEC